MIDLMLERLARFGLPLSIVLALAADFPWGDFQGHSHWHNVRWIPFMSPPVHPLDTALNFLLFVPLGFFGYRRDHSMRSTAVQTVVIAAIVSTVGEWMQVYSHTRIPSATDIVSNVAGALGGLVLALYGRRIPAMKTLLHLGVFAACFLIQPPAALAQGPDNVAVVINDKSAASQRVGEYYARKRGIPAANVIHISVTDSETIERSDYEERIARPVSDALTRHGLQDRVLYVVLTKGVPLRVAGTLGQSGTIASVDSELTLLYRRMTGIRVTTPGRVANPYYLGARSIRSATAFTHRAFDIYLVTRLDAFTTEEALALVDKALSPSREGKIVLDEKSTLIDRGGDAWLQAAATELAALGQGDRVLLESSRKIATDIAPVIGYYSWGSNDPANRIRRLRMGFVPGALAATFVSSDARTFQEPPASWLPSDSNDTANTFAGTPQSLIADLLREGATGAAGHVAEPFLESAVRPQTVFPAYVSGFNLAESFYLGMPYLSWQTVVIGDPLCAPFSGRTVAANELEPAVDPTTGLPVYFGLRRLTIVRKTYPRVSPDVVTHLVRAEASLAQGDVAAVRAALERATAADATLVGAELQLGALYEQAGLYDAAAKRYRKVIDRNPENVLALNNLAYLLAVRRGAAAEALPLATKAHALAPRSASVIDTLAWVEHLLGREKSAAILIAQAAELGPSNAEIQVHASAIYMAIGDRDRALAALKTALSLQPALETREDVRTLKERLASGGPPLLQR